MSTPEEFEILRKQRGAQLRALIVSWAEERPYGEALTAQQIQIDAGTFSPSEEWSVAADEILGFYMSIPRMTAWDEKPPAPKPPEPSRLILP
jgi:hypothetical protein